ncbi:MAG: DUF4338 domain-containing protein [Verrucomicrobia bacterium]|nr:DUF4338 domain-containing protein [Verrucomicrobiota bacterium]MDA1006436.1 DUF4338 domain-containing protein [Verrucomicrobiota bacterium]
MHTSDSPFGADHSVRGSLEIRLARTPADWGIARAMLDDEHFLGSGREAGDRLCQFVIERGEVVAVLIWCAAAWHIRERDLMIGWDPVTRSQRLKLVVQLRRFLVPDKARRPNLASQCLGFALRELPARWLEEHGYRPLMAESFSDPESHAGTVYKATNWICAGETKGFSQDHTDYYLPNQRPKKLWLKPLDPKAAVLMCAPHLTEDCRGALTAGGGARSPLRTGRLKTLRQAFELVPDPRRPQSRRHPLTAMLTLIALGLLMGGRDMLNIWRKVAKLDQRQREAIGLRVREKQSGRLRMPGYDALNDLMNAIDPHAYAATLTEWLQANAGILPRSLALDGKNIGDGKCGMIITLCRHEDGRPVAMIPATGKKEDCEVSEARALLADPLVNLENALVTADPLHNKEPTLRVIVEKGGDYLVGTKDNTPNRLKAVETTLGDAPFLT